MLLLSMLIMSSFDVLHCVQIPSNSMHISVLQLSLCWCCTYDIELILLAALSVVKTKDSIRETE